MGKSVPKPPPAPDPYATAAAQTGTNVMTAQANTIMGNADERSPLGSVKYNVTGYQKVKDPVSGKTYKIPKYERVQALSKSEQALYKQQNQLGQGLNNLAIQQTGKITDLMGEPITLDGLPDAPGNSEEYRQKVEEGMFARMNPQLQRSRDALEARLVNQGLIRGSEAFTRAMEEAGQQENDARTQVFLASGAESRAEQQQQGTNRERAFQERVALRTQPINEITALMSGGQVTMPQFTPYRGSQMSETPVGDYVYRTAAMEQDNWKTRTQMKAQNNAAIAGSIGNIAAGAFKWSDRRLKTDVEFVGNDGTYNWYTFRYIGEVSQQFGVMAQEVLTINPDAVQLMPNGFYAVNYGAL